MRLSANAKVRTNSRKRECERWVKQQPRRTNAASQAIAAGSPGSATGVSTSPADDPKQRPGSPSNCSYPGGSCREDETKATDGA